MTTIPSLATASEVKALVDAGSVSALDGAKFVAARFGRKVRDGKAVTGNALDVFASLMGHTPDKSKGFNAYREHMLTIAKGLVPEAFAAAPPKAAGKATGKSAAKPKASAKGKAKPASKPAAPASAGGFTKAQKDELAAMIAGALAAFAK